MTIWNNRVLKRKNEDIFLEFEKAGLVKTIPAIVKEEFLINHLLSIGFII